jgi:hypothetical protein
MRHVSDRDSAERRVRQVAQPNAHVELLAARRRDRERVGGRPAPASRLGKHAGLSDADVVQARQGRAGDPKADAAVRFAQSLVDNRGHPSDAELAALRRGGFSDGEIVDLVAATVLNIFTNYLNRVAETEIDFPVVRSGVCTAA